MSFIADEYPDYVCLNCDSEFSGQGRNVVCPFCGSTHILTGEEQARNEAINAEDDFREDMQIQREIRRDDGIS